MAINPTLIISVYNQSKQLKILLDTVAKQTYNDFELIIADDGSSDHPEKIINTFVTHHPAFKVKYLSQEDIGFQKTILLNKAFKLAKGNYFIVIDGDMLLHPKFIENHLRYSHPDRILSGYRGVKLEENFTEAILNGSVTLRTNYAALLYNSLFGRMMHASRGLEIHTNWLRKLLLRKSHRLSGCNFSVYKEKIFNVNGMDESILTYGFEDFELGHRLQLLGLQIFDVSRCCITYHLEHPKSSGRNVKNVLKSIQKKKQIQCKHGLEKLDQGSSMQDFLIEDNL